MEYDSPLFIAAVKKILRESVAHLSDSIENLKNAVSTHWQTDEKRYQTKPITVADLRTDVPIPVEDKTKKTKPEWAWAIFIGALEALAFIAIIVYTGVAYQQWQELITGNDVSMSNFRRARIDANEQIKLGIIAANAATESARVARDTLTVSNRPWVGVVGTPTITDFSIKPRTNNRTEIHVDMSYQVTNYGSSPALHLNFHIIPDFLNYKWQGSFATQEYLIQNPMKSACFFADQFVIDRPLIGAYPRPGVEKEKFVAKARGLTVFPTQKLVINEGGADLDEGSNLDALKGKSLLLFGCIAYADQFGKKVIHHTRYCFQIPAPIQDFAAGKPVETCGITTDAD